MSRMFEELDYRVTPMGALSLRRRRYAPDGEPIYEIILNGEYLMSSRFTVAEVALTQRGLARCRPGPLDVVVGGLGLGYTAQAALEHPQLHELYVVERIPEVIEWHQRGILPLGEELTADPRCHFVADNFFTLAASDDGFDATAPERRFDAVLLDIDHSPGNVLHPAHASFYSARGLANLKQHLAPRGVFALWSTAAPDADFIASMEAVFDRVQADRVGFPGPHGENSESNTIYSGIACDREKE